MSIKKVLKNINIQWGLAFILLSACVDSVHFDVPPADLQFVVEGMITDGPAPYTVKVSTALNLSADSLSRPPVEKAKVKLYDDEGHDETLVEINPGEYLTTGIIMGKVGHSYYITIETADGRRFQSTPDRIYPVGEIDSIRYEFEARTKEEEYGDVKADVFNIYVNANAGNGDENFVRWRFNGTYKVLTNPELRETKIMEFTIKDPLPCSGYIVSPAPGGGKLEQVADCTCCTCWAKNYETMPQLSDVQLINNNQFKNIKVAEVPINQATFYDKYRVEIEQMSLSKMAFDFFKLIRTQKEGASNIFQPPSGEIKGNVTSVSSSDRVIGIFWATSLKSKSLYINRSEVPYKLPPIYYVTDKCTNYYANSSTAKPTFWE
ncbi:MAG: hypothetical protein C0523_04130 [Cytophaga sp.]|nr:hypothetical protein [Cytophaga sp.]